MILGQFAHYDMVIEVESMAPSTTLWGDVLYLRRIDVFPEVLVAERGPSGLHIASTFSIDKAEFTAALEAFLSRVQQRSSTSSP